MTYLTGDLHSDISDSRFDFFNKLKEEDIVICLGDFGFNWSPFHTKMFNIPCTMLFLAGNHENYDVLRNLKSIPMYDSEVGVLKDRVYLLKNGMAYNINNKNYFIFGGASSIDKSARTPYVSWWPEEVPSSEEVNRGIATLEKNNYKTDYFLSHTCSSDFTKNFHYTYKFKDPVEDMIKNFEDLLDSHGADYQHFFGHHHTFMKKGKNICMFRDIYCIETEKYLHYDFM